MLQADVGLTGPPLGLWAWVLHGWCTASAAVSARAVQLLICSCGEELSLPSRLQVMASFVLLVIFHCQLVTIFMFPSGVFFVILVTWKFNF